MLTKILFPGVPYPAALIWHLILGAFLFALPAAVLGFRGDFVGPWHWWQPVVVQVVVVLTGLLVSRAAK